MEPVHSVYNMASGSKTTATGALEDGDLCLSYRLTCANKTAGNQSGQLWYGHHVTGSWKLEKESFCCCISVISYQRVTIFRSHTSHIAQPRPVVGVGRVDLAAEPVVTPDVGLAI